MNIILVFIASTLAVLTLILASKAKKIRADRYLIAFFISIIFGVLNDILQNNLPVYQSFFRFGGVSVPAATAFLYLYVLSLTTAESLFRSRHLLLFLPATFVFFINCFYSEINLIESSNHILKAFYYLLKLGTPVLIILLSRHRLKRYSEGIKNCFSDIESIDLQWLKTLINSCLLLFLFVIAGFILFRLRILINLKLLILLTNISIFTFTFFIAFYGIRNTNTFKDIVIQGDNGIGEESDAGIKEASSPEKDAIADEYAEKLSVYMEREKPHLSEKITIAELSEKTNIQQRLLSNIINARFHMTFFDFINWYRVNEFNNRVEKGDMKHLTILAIAFECGFSSKSAFNRAYKKHTGVPPSAFTKKHTPSKG